MKGKENVLRKFQKEFVDSMIDLDPKFSKYIDDHFWNLLCDDEDVRIKNYERNRYKERNNSK